MPSNSNEIQKLYVEYLGRPADPAGLAFWVHAMGQNAAAGLAAAKNALSMSVEFTSAFVGLSNEQAVDKIYLSLFDRHADEPGLAFWANQLQSKTITLADMVGVIGAGAQEDDLALLNNRIAAAEAFTAALDRDAEIAGYNGDAAAGLAKAYLVSVTDAASLSAALAALPDTIVQVTGVAPDHAQTGSAVASGTAVEGQTLSASNTLDDADGLGAVTYQWKAGGVDINGATGAVFTLTAAQVGKPITVVASYIDGLGAHVSVASNVIASGNDMLKGSAGADVLSGGTGDDTYVVNAAGDVIVENAGEGVDQANVAFATAGTYTLAANVENATVTAGASIAVNLIGNALNNVLTGNAAANTLTGGAGNDTLDGGAGADKLAGGLGDDTYFVDNAADVVTEAANEGTDTVRTALATATLAANVENLTYTGAAAFSGTGNLLNNIITGGNAGNKLDGGAGNDTLNGGAGNDSLQGGAGDDSLDAGGGKDTIDGGDGADTLRVHGDFASYTVTRPNATDTVLTDAGGNVLTVRNVETFSFADGDKSLAQVQDNIASAGNDRLHGTDGNDVLNGGLGVDTLDGGLGNDTYVILNAADVVVEGVDGGTDLAQVALAAAGTYKLADNVENATVTAAASVAANITGNELDNHLTGNAAVNALVGGAGNDTLDGGAGADKLSGGSGDDVYVVDNAGDVVTELANDGIDRVETTLAAYTLAANVENLSYTGAAAFTGTGNALDNVITGGEAGSKLDGGAGNDTLTGGAGNDSLQGGTGNDSLDAGGGKDTIDGGDGADTLRVHGDFASYTITRPNATDTVLTDAGGNVLTVRNVETFSFADGDKSLTQVQDNIASVGNDSLHGTGGNDVLNGGLGVDTLDGGIGDDTYVIMNAADTIVEMDGGGTDLAQVALAAAGTYKLADNVENATVTAAASVAVNLTGNALDNVLTGNAAANALIGGAGNDTLDGGAGADKLSGGSGDDVYVVDNAGDVVTELVNDGIDSVATTLAAYTLTANVENLRYTGTAAFTGTGNALDNIIGGGKGNDNLQGGLGNDTFIASAGKDTIDGGIGGDALEGLGLVGDYTISRPNALDTVLKDAAGNQITVRNVELFHFADGDRVLADLQDNIASAGNDHLHGGDGKDVLNGGLGVDTLDGGLGNDTYVILNLQDVVLEQVGGGVDEVQVGPSTAGTYTLADNVENAIVTAAATVAVNLTGNDLDNILTGNAGANTLNGGAGNDTLIGGAGADKLLGGAGDDVYLVADAGDVVTELANGGHDVVRTSLASLALVANVEDLAYIGAGAFSGTGNLLDNVISGGNGGAKLDGGAGNDTLVGGFGNDSLQGGLGDDVFQTGGGKDTIDGGAGDDVVRGLGYFGDYVVTRPNAIDTVLTDHNGNVLTLRNVETLAFADGDKTFDEVRADIVSVGNDYLHGTDGNDVLNGGLGADTLAGGGGDDLYIIANVADVIIENGGEGIDQVNVALTAAATYVMADNVEIAVVTAAAGIAVNITGNDLDNELTGNAAANTLIGGAGDDTLDGGAGNDVLKGGAGDDLYIVGEAGDTVVELVGDGIDTVITSLASYTLGANVEALFYTGGGKFSGVGNALDNVLNATYGGADVKFDGGAGNDLLVDGYGNDSLQGGTGDDVILVSHGKDTVDGGAGDDTLGGLDYADHYAASWLNATDLLLTHNDGSTVTVRDVETFEFTDGVLTLAQLRDMVAGTGADTIYGTDGSDGIDGGPGADVMIGGAGNDTYFLSTNADVIVEDAGPDIDTALLGFAAAATYTMAPNVERAIVTAAATIAVNVVGNELANYIEGNAAANTLNGGAGNDTLVGGAGNDTMVGGLGDDHYVVGEAGDSVVEKSGEGVDVVYTTLASYKLGANVESLVYTGEGAFTGTGNELNNALVAENGTSAKLDGGAGNDLLIGGHGNDSLQGGVGDDVLAFSNGKDTVDGGAGFDVLSSLYAFDRYTVVQPNATDTVLTDIYGDVTTVRGVESFIFNGVTMTLAELRAGAGTGGNDVLSGTAGNDTLDGGAGNDTMYGGAGDDTYMVSSVGDLVVENPNEGLDSVKVGLTAAGTYVMTSYVENAYVTAAAGIAVNVTGNIKANYIVGNAAANKLVGGDGNDTLEGGAGNDTLTGGTGDDLYLVSEAGDVIVEAAGEGWDQVQVSVASYTMSANVDTMFYSGTGAFTGTGNAGANYMGLVHNDGGGSVKLNGGAGDDTLAGGAGNDSLAGGADNDSFRAGGGKDTIDGGAGQDTLGYLGDFASYTVSHPNATDVVLTDAAGNVIVARDVEFFEFADATRSLAEVRDNVVSTDNDYLRGTAGADLLNGGLGVDTMAGGLGDDTYVVDRATDLVLEEADAGVDLVRVAFTAAGTYVLADNVENATVTAAATIAVNLTGNALNNALSGNAAANTLIGGDGDDTLDGGAGSDKLTGGAGADTFVFGSLAGSDAVSDFLSGTDRVVVSQSGIAVGNGDISLDEAVVRAAPGGFARDAELVLFTQKMATASAASAAAVIGSATSAYAAGDTALFAVSTATATTLYLFKSAGNDALVSAAELTQLAVLTGTPTTDLSDYGLVM
jgi:Ca2+-binding RTX toxin-like protein